MKQIIFALFFIGLVGCASTVSISPNDLIPKAGKHLDGEFSVLYVPSRGALSDGTFITLSKSSGSSAIAKRLARIFATAESEDVQIAVGGPNSAMSSIVIINAADSNKDRKLTGLSLVFVGDPSHSEGVKEKIDALGGKYYFEAADL